MLPCVDWLHAQPERERRGKKAWAWPELESRLSPLQTLRSTKQKCQAVSTKQRNITTTSQWDKSPCSVRQRVLLFLPTTWACRWSALCLLSPFFLGVEAKISSSNQPTKLGLPKTPSSASQFSIAGDSSSWNILARLPGTVHGQDLKRTMVMIISIAFISISIGQEHDIHKPGTWHHYQWWTLKLHCAFGTRRPRETIGATGAAGLPIYLTESRQCLPGRTRILHISPTSTRNLPHLALNHGFSVASYSSMELTDNRLVDDAKAAGLVGKLRQGRNQRIYSGYKDVFKTHNQQHNSMSPSVILGMLESQYGGRPGIASSEGTHQRLRVKTARLSCESEQNRQQFRLFLSPVNNEAIWGGWLE